MRYVIAMVLVASAALLLHGTAHADELGDALAGDFRCAHDSKDVERLKSLVYWEGATESTREKITERLTRHIGRKVETIEFRELSGSERFEVGGYMPNLKPVGWLVVYFEHDPYDTRIFSTFFVVGELDGTYMITVAEKEN